jgi:hypothetical protein
LVHSEKERILNKYTVCGRYDLNRCVSQEDKEYCKITAQNLTETGTVFLAFALTVFLQGGALVS